MRYIQTDDDYIVADVNAGRGEIPQGEALANAELITEAFNVANETRRTPRQIADERAELIAALRSLHNYTRGYCSSYMNALDAQSDEVYTKTDELLTRLQS